MKEVYLTVCHETMRSVSENQHQNYLGHQICSYIHDIWFNLILVGSSNKGLHKLVWKVLMDANHEINGLHEGQQEVKPIFDRGSTKSVQRLHE